MFMKSFFTILLLTPFLCNAQDTPQPKLRKSTFYINAGLDYQYNRNDVTNNTEVDNVLTSDNTLGYRIGLEYNKATTTGIFFAAGIDYRIVPQSLSINYSAQAMGYTGAGDIYNSTNTFSFNSMYVSPFARMGYSAPIKPGKSSFDFSFGAAFLFGVNGGSNGGQFITKPAPGSEYTDVVMHIDNRWGTTLLDYDNGKVPVNALFNLQLGYTTKIGSRKIKTAIDLSGAANKRMNRTAVNYFGPGRSDEGNSIYADLFQSIGILVGIGI